MYSQVATYLALTLATVPLVAGDLPAAHGPPPNSDPLTWGFYATPEFQDPIQLLEIEGEIPAWLSGSLYRGAAGTWDTGNYTAEHWFDGFSRTHLFVMDNGTVSYRNRNSTDELRDFVRETGTFPTGNFGSDPCKIIFGAFEITYRDGIHPVGNTSSANIGVSFIANLPGLARNTTTTGSPLVTLVKTVESNSLQQIDPVTLEPIELFDFQAYDLALNSTGHMAAHGVHWPDGSIYNYNLNLKQKPPTYQIFGVSADAGQTSILATIDDAPPAYIHSMFNTENYLVLIVWQSDFTKVGKTDMSSMGPWNPDRKSLFYVVDRKNGGVVSKYVSADAFFAFHQINSFEDGNGDINIDIPTFQNNSFLYAAEVPALRQNLGQPGASAHDLAGNFTRYKLSMNSATAKLANGSLNTQPAEVIFSLPYHTHNIELPRINDAYYRKQYRYAYGIHTEKAGYFADSLIKVDTQTYEAKLWSPAVNQVPSEPIFVPTPNSQAEDDGVLLMVAMNSQEKNSALVVVNATTMAEIGRAKMPLVMGYGFHGVWGSTDYLSYY